MAFQCLDKLIINGTTYNLAQVTDFSIIPSSLESASPTTMIESSKQSNAGVLPSSLSTFGDLFMNCTSGTGDTMVVHDDEYFGIKIGRVHHGDYYSDSPNATGWVTQDKVANRLINNMGWGDMSGNAFRIYFAIVYDFSTERAYFIGIRDQYAHWGGNTGVFFHVFGGLSNGTDIFYQAFISSLIQSITSNGGGATHIAKVTGQLKDLSSNLSDILMVSGGGGGGYLVGEDAYNGADAGGISGSGSNSGNQSTGYAFGQGESGTDLSGGGSGYYGGEKGGSLLSGGAGSGYIGNSLVNNKKMVGYNVPTSSAEGTKTESVNDVSASAVSGKPKSGNGFVRIKFLREAWGGEEVPILWAGNSNKMTVQISNSSILFKLYTGDSVIYSFTAYAGSMIYDADNIYVGFLIDTSLELAKPSMIYDNNSVLSYNQEEPTEAQMGDIYTWISPGLPSE